MNIIIIMSGGVGNRFGANIPKQYCKLNGRPVIDYVIDAAKGSKVADKVIAMGGAILITADHGNAEQMIDPADGSVFTAHSTNVVPLIAAGVGDVKLSDGRLADLAPTLINIMELEVPAEMTGKNLIIG